RDAATRARGHLADRVRLDRPPEPLREALRTREIGLGQDRDELLAAPAADRVSLPREGAEEPADLTEHHVAGRVAEGVVDLLEAVEIEQHDRELVGEALGA